MPVVKLPLGGKIFYVDNTASGATYKFYDDSDNEVIYTGTVKSLSNATQYTVTGTPTKDKFYVYYAESYYNLAWASAEAYRGVGDTSIGAGKRQTQTMLGYEKDNTNTIWFQLNELNKSSLGGYSDWFIGSKAELTELINNAWQVVLDKIDYCLWTSSESTALKAWDYNKDSSMFTNSDTKFAYGTIIPIRSF